MDTKQNVTAPASDVWSRLAAPVPESAIAWRQDGRPTLRDGRYYARFVAYVDASTVRDRLDTVVPGEWSLTLEPLTGPQSSAGSNEPSCAFKARLEIRGVAREDVGVGRDYKAAATDAFKRAAVRFGIAHELYAYKRNWVEVEGDSGRARPLEDPAVVYARKANMSAVEAAFSDDVSDDSGSDDTNLESVSSTRALDEPECPKCGGRMWDNRLTKRNPRAPDYRCRNRSCEGVIWPERPAQQQTAA